MKIIDISVALNSEMPAWPGSARFSISWSSRIENGDDFNSSVLVCDSHSGTHVDAPLHFIPAGATVDHLDLDVLNGLCQVVFLPDNRVIDAALLAGVQVPAGTSRLLLRTDNSRLWTDSGSVFEKDFAAISLDAADWIVEHGIQLVGIDYLSIEKFQQGTEVHKKLLANGVVILEGLDLTDVPAGEYELLCLPIKIAGAEGAPARAVLRKVDDRS